MEDTTSEEPPPDPDRTDDTGRPSTSSGRPTRRLPVPAWSVIVVAGLVVVLVLLLAARIGGSASDRPATVTVIPSKANAARFDLHYITHFGKDLASPDHDLTFTDGAFRITSLDDDKTVNRREVWTFPGNHADVDVTVLIDEPSSLSDRNLLQPGLALRTHVNEDGSGAAIIVDQNIWARRFNDLKIGLWRWPADLTRVRITSGPTAPLSIREATITSVTRKAGDPSSDVYGLLPVPGVDYSTIYRIGDRVDIRSSFDKSFTHLNAVVTGIGTHLLVVKNPDTKAAVPPKAETGTVRLTPTPTAGSAALMYPRYFRARMVGDRLQVKSWLAEEPEPGWQVTYDFSEVPGVPETGEVGLVANHLRWKGDYIAFGDLTITPVTGP